MNTAEAERRIRHDGFTLLPGVIPAADVAAIRDAVVEAQGRRRAESEAMLAAIRAKGHRVSVTGVDSLRGVINETRLFAPYLADERLLAICRAFFGEHFRITTTDCVINRPGCGRGYWHSDWPYNQTNASHIPAPYPDTLLHLSTIWMLTDFTPENGGTLLVPGSHRFGTNPSAGTLPGVDRDAPYPTETHAVGAAGSVLVYDSRLWHAVPPNRSDEDRVALVVRYAPWWLNLEPAREGGAEHTAMVVETNGKNYASPEIRPEVWAELPKAVKPLYRHWVAAG
ncbi:MAG: phytanoyl-CoA dioxygenase family protein [Gemmatimonadaceae bacterium]|nr:phytanoyl-CoA dioxygenase family protein [Gemmatimonadaceae bacterium]